MIKNEKIKSEFDRMAVNVLKQLVPGQKMRLDAIEGKVWESVCVDSEGMALTTIKRNDEVVAKIVYDYETGQEREFLY